MYPILIDFGFWQLSTYGLFTATAYLVGILWLKSQIPFMPNMNEDKFWKLVYALFAGAILGGKFLYLALNLEHLEGGLQFFKDFRYGFVFFGGLLGAMLTGFWATRRLKLPYLGTADYLGVMLPLGHWLGRLGCLGAGCCYGKPTTLPWGVSLGASSYSSTPRHLWGMPLHPTQLYEAAADILMALFLLCCMLPRAKNKMLAPGTVFLSYAMLYSAARFAVEFFRGDDRGWTMGALSISQWISVAVFLGAAVVMVRRGVKSFAGVSRA